LKINPKNLNPNSQVMHFLTLFHNSSIPYKWNNTRILKSTMLSIFYRNSDTLILFTPSRARWQINSKDRNEYGHRLLEFLKGTEPEYSFMDIKIVYLCFSFGNQRIFL